MKFTILHTNDIHSHFNSIPRIATIFKQYNDSNTIKLDAGDFIDSCDYLVVAENGKYGSSLLSYLDYDAATIGNNEYLLTSTKIYEESKTPYICCNLTNMDSTPLTGVAPSIIKIINGIRFLIIGNTVNGIDTYNEVLSLYNKRAHFIEESLRHVLNKHKGMYDIAIVLSHASYEEDIELADLFPEIQIIIGGHTHLLMENIEKHNNAYLHISGQYGEYVGKLTLDIDDETKTIVSCQSEQIPTSTIIDDEPTKAYLEQLRSIAISQLKTPIFSIDYELAHSLTYENSISNMLADALYHYCDCDLGIINTGIISQGLPKGPISEYDLLNSIPSPMNPSFAVIKGKNIKEAYLLSLNNDYVMKPGRAPGYRGKHIGTLAFSSNVEIIDGSIYINNELLDEHREYHVLTSGYLQKGSGYPSLASTKEVSHKSILIRDLFKEYIKKNKPKI